MTIVPLGLEGVYAIDPEPVRDERGWFARTWDADALAGLGLASRFVQQSAAWNAAAGTVRGLHVALPPAAEAKLVRCIRGAVFDVVADVRPRSQTYGTHVAVRLDDENRRMLYIPPGCAHGYQTLTPNAELLYDISEAYREELAGGVAHDDPELAIGWPLPVAAISPRDAALPRLAAFAAARRLEVSS